MTGLLPGGYPLHRPGLHRGLPHLGRAPAGRAGLRCLADLGRAGRRKVRTRYSCNHAVLLQVGPGGQTELRLHPRHSHRRVQVGGTVEREQSPTGLPRPRRPHRRLLVLLLVLSFTLFEATFPVDDNLLFIHFKVGGAGGAGKQYLWQKSFAGQVQLGRAGIHQFPGRQS